MLFLYFCLKLPHLLHPNYDKLHDRSKFTATRMKEEVRKILIVLNPIQKPT